jgi:hypothetical protein
LRIDSCSDGRSYKRKNKNGQNHFDDGNVFEITKENLLRHFRHFFVGSSSNLPTGTEHKTQIEKIFHFLLLFS